MKIEVPNLTYCVTKCQNIDSGNSINLSIFIAHSANFIAKTQLYFLRLSLRSYAKRKH